MLDLIVNSVSVIGLGLYYGLLISYKTGQFLVYVGHNVVFFTGEFLVNVLTLLRVISEDFTYFLRDVTAGIHTLITLMINISIATFNGISNAVTNACNQTQNAYLMVVGVFVSFASTAKNIIGSIQYFIFTIKKFIVLFGSGIWFALTLIPLSIVYFCTTVTYCFGRIIEEMFSMVLSAYKSCNIACFELYSFVTDVPFESIAGLFAACCIVYLLLHFQVMIVNYFYIQAAKTYVFISNQIRAFSLFLVNMYLIRSWTFLRNMYTRLVVVSHRDSESVREPPQYSSPNLNLDNQFCVVCQEELKCVLTLPCRHVSMCTYCYNQLRYTSNRKCPLCRRYIEKCMKVYI